MIDRAPHGLEVPYLRARRLWAGLSQTELAQAAQVDPLTIRKVENGQPARFAVIARLAAALGLSRQQLLHELPEPEKVRA